jgi:hypothetical protein
MALTEALKAAFAVWMKGILHDNKNTIESAKPGISFDTDGLKNGIGSRQAQYEAEEGKLTALEEQKRRQTDTANAALDDLYRFASDTADSVVGHLGKQHELSKLIRNKRDSFDHASPNKGGTPPTP